MGLLFSITLPFLSLAILQSLTVKSQPIKSARLLDLLIRDYTFKSYHHNFKTGKPHQVNLPSNLSGINVEAIRVRCGSLRRYGAQLNEFHLGIGIHIHPCIKRVILIRQNLGSNFSSIYYQNYDLSGYQLISPILGLLAYNDIAPNVNAVPSLLGIESGKNSITIDFSNTSLLNTISRIIPLCASFDLDGKVSLSNQMRENVCVSTKHGHFALVVRSPLIPFKRKVSKLKLVIGSVVGVILGVFLLSLLVIAMFVNAKKKARMDEIERRAYEEEALQVSMAGHVRAFTSLGTRTVPTIEHHDYRHPFP